MELRYNTFSTVLCFYLSYYRKNTLMSSKKKQYFLLIRENEGIKKKTSYIGRNKEDVFTGFRGSIYKERSEKTANNTSIISLVSLINDDHYLDVNLPELLEISDIELELLLPIETDNIRYQIAYEKPEHLRNAVKARVGDIAVIDIGHGEQDMRYIEEIKQKKGQKGYIERYFVLSKSEYLDKNQYRVDEIEAFIFDNIDEKDIDKAEIIEENQHPLEQYYLLKDDQFLNKHVVEAGSILKESNEQHLDSKTVKVIDIEIIETLEVPTEKLYLLTDDELKIAKSFGTPMKRVHYIIQRKDLVKKVLALEKYDKVQVFVNNTTLRTGKFLSRAIVNDAMYFKVMIDKRDKPYRIDVIWFDDESSKKIVVAESAENIPKEKKKTSKQNAVTKAVNSDTSTCVERNDIIQRFSQMEVDVAVMVPIIDKTTGKKVYKSGKIKCFKNIFETIFVGVLMDEMTDDAKGHYYKDQKFFDCPPYHGVVIDVNSVIPKESFHPNEDKPKEEEFVKVPPTDVNGKSNFMNNEQQGTKKEKDQCLEPVTPVDNNKQLNRKYSDDDITYLEDIRRSQNAPSNIQNNEQVTITNFPDILSVELVHKSNFPGSSQSDAAKMIELNNFMSKQMQEPSASPSTKSSSFSYTNDTLYGHSQQNGNKPFPDTNYNQATSLATQEKQDLDIGSMIQFNVRNKIMTGCIQWIGKFKKTGDEWMAGLELDEGQELIGNCDGSFAGERKFTCPKGRGLFLKLSVLRRDARFNDTNAANQPCFVPDTALIIEDKYQHPITSIKGLTGLWKGIQGHLNSCYMDSTLFAMFACTNVFDPALHGTKRQSERYQRVQEVLKNQIVNPLRRDGYIPAKNIKELRHHLDAVSDSKLSYMNDEQDAEEFVNLLFDKILGFPPFINIWSEKNKSMFSTHLHQIFITDYESQPLPSVQYLLDKSFLEEETYLESIPDIMILHMPRHGKEKMFPKIQVTSTIDLSNVLKGVAQYCVLCSKPAEVYCPKCFSDFGKNTTYPFMCINCLNLSHNHPSRRSHPNALVRRILPLNPAFYQYQRPPPGQFQMELFAVLCIELSHYVSFVRCADTWVFFDSMADRVGEKDGYNIPLVTEVPNLDAFLETTPLRIANLKDPKKINHTARLFEDAYMCFYRRKVEQRPPPGVQERHYQDPSYVDMQNKYYQGGTSL